MQRVKQPTTVPTLKMMARPNDINVGGTVFGGWTLSQSDIAASMEAYNVTNNRVVTHKVLSFVFLKPMFVGDMVSFYGTVENVEDTSVTINIDVYADRRNSSSTILAATGKFLFVNVDENGRRKVIVQA